jgi:hypothetical protein
MVRTIIPTPPSSSPRRKSRHSAGAVRGHVHDRVYADARDEPAASRGERPSGRLPMRGGCATIDGLTPSPKGSLYEHARFDHLCGR